MPEITGGFPGTRSSARWLEKPGSFDRLNIRYIFHSDSVWGIPQLDPSDVIPTSLSGWHDITGIKNHPDSFVHFFLDDYHFESIWNKPEQSIDKISLAAGALTPDFSTWVGMPWATQIYNVYRSCWVGCLWQAHGIEVIPTVQWSEPWSFAFCFDGLPENSSVAVSAMGIRKHEVESFDLGLRELIKRKSPTHLIVYGKLPGYVPDIDVREYPTHWQRNRGKKLWAEEAAAVEAVAVEAMAPATRK